MLKQKVRQVRGRRGCADNLVLDNIFKYQIEKLSNTSETGREAERESKVNTVRIIFRYWVDENSWTKMCS